MGIRHVFGCLLGLAGAAEGPQAHAALLGMVLDDRTQSATVFDADTDTVVGSVQVGLGIADCAVTDDQQTGFVVSRNHHVTVLDLPVVGLSGGVGTIPISNPGLDVSLTPDGRFLLSCGNTSVVSVVDVQMRSQVATLDVGAACSAVDACADGSILIESDGFVRRLRIDGDASLTDTGERTAGRNPFCAGTHAGAAMQPHKVVSFTVPGLVPQGEGNLFTYGESGIALGGQSNRAGDRIYVLNTNEGDLSQAVVVDVFALDALTGRLHGLEETAGNSDITPIQSYRVGAQRDPIEESGIRDPGIDRLALSPYGDKVYVSANLDVANFIDDPRLENVLFPTGVAQVRAPIRAASMLHPSAVCLPRNPYAARTRPRLAAWGRPVIDGLFGPTLDVMARLETMPVPPERIKRLAGRSIEFRTLSGAFICQALTDVRGYALCAGLIDLAAMGGVPSFANARYTARFLGDRWIDESSASARMIFGP